MFNVGIIGSRTDSLFRLTGGLLNWYWDAEAGWDVASTTLLRDGRRAITPGWTAYVQSYVSGEWYKPAPIEGIGDGFEARSVLLAGYTQQAPGGRSFSTWADINSEYRLSPARIVGVENGGGRFQIEIRNKATQQIVASAIYWTSGYAP